jgi:hypothetical protein
MATEFEKRVNQLALDNATRNKLIQIISEAGKEFPCLSCPSKDECASFDWFIKWFGTAKNPE